MGFPTWGPLSTRHTGRGSTRGPSRAHSRWEPAAGREPDSRPLVSVHAEVPYIKWCEYPEDFPGPGDGPEGPGVSSAGWEGVLRLQGPKARLPTCSERPSL